MWGSGLPAADLDEAREQLRSGDYAGCIASARAGLKDQSSSEDWQLLLIQALLATGQYPEALAATTNALSRDSSSIPLRWQAREVLLSNGLRDQANQVLDSLVANFNTQPRAFREPPNLVISGQIALLKGADPKRVLEVVFDSARKAAPGLRDVYLAMGNLALEKHDYALAARKFEEGLKQLPDDADLHFGLARAYAPSEHALMVASLEAALQHNTNHVGVLLLLTDRSIDGEDFTQATNLLDRVKQINPWHPEAWAYQAVVAHLQNQPALEQEARQRALRFWTNNPAVDFCIGRKLSQNYRFQEGAEHQRQALRFDPGYLPAKAQLAQDLLRLGKEEEGWQLAEEVHKQDGYDVTLYNLTTLRDAMGKFAVLTNQHFVLRLSQPEAALYGQRALEVLSQAKSNLCARYGLELSQPTTVEIFPEQKDFAVRTFGMPGNPGYLGVCFGHLITANGPRAQASQPVNWEAVLWHEFCHVVTLQMTRNKMPRWLSEGISVYEELQQNPAWGQRMNPRYREMILGGELTPVSKLSAAFLSPRSALHLQFAYYESSLVVEFLVERFGFEALKAILKDLREGVSINDALARHTLNLQELDDRFDQFARTRAEQMAPGLDWTRPNDDGDALSRVFDAAALSKALIEQSKTNSAAKSTNGSPGPRPNFYQLMEAAQTQLEAKQFEQAKGPLGQLIELYPQQTGGDSAYALLAAAHRALGETKQEREVLAKLAAQDDSAREVYHRLMELAAKDGDWPAVVQNAQRYLAVNPLVPPPYRFLAQAAEETRNPMAAIRAYRALLQLDPSDPAETHYRLARSLYQVKDPAARREVLEALEEAPRHPGALQLLLELHTRPLQPKDTSSDAAQ